MRRAFALLALLLLCACSYQQLFDRLSSAQEQALALQAAKAIQRGDRNWLAARAMPALRPQVDATLVSRMRALAPEGQPILSAVNVRTMQDATQRQVLKQFVYEISGKGKFALLQVVLETEGATPLINGMFVQPVDRSVREANALTLKGKGFIHFLWLGMMAAAIVISLTAFVLAIRTPRLSLKWLWCIGVLFSFVMFQLDWTSGAWGVTPIGVLLLGAAAFQGGPLAPWVMSVAIPVIAILFLVLRALGRLPRNDDTTQPPAPRKEPARLYSGKDGSGDPA